MLLLRFKLQTRASMTSPPVYDEQMGPHIRTLCKSLVPGGQEVDVTDHPVAAATEAHPSLRTDGCRRSKEMQVTVDTASSFVFFSRGTYC